MQVKRIGLTINGLFIFAISVNFYFLSRRSTKLTKVSFKPYDKYEKSNTGGLYLAKCKQVIFEKYQSFSSKITQIMIYIYTY